MPKATIADSTSAAEAGTNAPRARAALRTILADIAASPTAAAIESDVPSPGNDGVGENYYPPTLTEEEMVSRPLLRILFQYARVLEKNPTAKFPDDLSEEMSEMSIADMSRLASSMGNYGSDELWGPQIWEQLDKRILQHGENEISSKADEIDDMVLTRQASTLQDALAQVVTVWGYLHLINDNDLLFNVISGKVPEVLHRMQPCMASIAKFIANLLGVKCEDFSSFPLDPEFHAVPQKGIYDWRTSSDLRMFRHITAEAAD